MANGIRRELGPTIRFCARTLAFTALLCVAVGLMAPIFFDGNINPQRDPPQMGLDAALGLTLIACCVFLLNSSSKVFKKSVLICATSSLLIGAATLTAHLVDKLQMHGASIFFAELFGGNKARRMSAAAATLLVLTAVGILCKSKRNTRWLSDVCAACACFITFLTILESVYSSVEPQQRDAYLLTPVSVNLAFLFLNLALFTSPLYPRWLLIGLGQSYAGKYLRRCLACAIFVPPTLGLIRFQLQYYWQYELPFGLAIMTTCFITSVILLGLWSGIRFYYEEITAKNLLQRVLHSNREAIFLDALLSKSEQPFIVTDANFQIERTNKAFELLIGYSAEKLQGLMLDVILKPEQYHEIRESLKSPQENHRSFLNQFILKNSNNEWLHLEATIGSYRETNHTPLYFYFFIVDNRERSHADRLFRTAVEASPNGIIMINSSGKIVLANSQAELMFGYQTEKLLGRQIEELLPARYQDEHPRLRGSYFANPQTRPMGLGRELFGLRRNGQEFPLEIGLSPVETEQEIFVLSSIVDITKRREAEAATANLASIVSSAEDAIISEDLQGIVSSWNTGAEKLFGYSAPEMVGTDIRQLIPLEMHADEDIFLGKIALGKKVEHYETVRVHRTGRRIDVSLSMSPLHDAHGVVIGASKILRDNTLAKEYLNKLESFNAELDKGVKERTAELQVANRELEAFSYSVSHDLRAPLRAINGFAKILKRDLAQSLTSKHGDYLQDLLTNTERMRQIIDDLLSFSRLGRQPLNKQNVSCTRLVADCINDVRSFYSDLRLNFQMDDLPDCWGDSSLLRQVWTNLLANACKFSAKDQEPLIQIGSLSVPREDSKNSFETAYFIRDNGVGFDMQFASKLFGVFQRLHNVENYEGSGIGLATAQRIVNKHGGRIWAESVINQGATFYFTIPKS